jgi:hypothetical protein|nr:hypothetical protein Q903MT_gene1067 [Picea sitchensis]
MDLALLMKEQIYLSSPLPKRKDLKLASGLGNPLDLHPYLDLYLQLA